MLDMKAASAILLVIIISGLVAWTVALAAQQARVPMQGQGQIKSAKVKIYSDETKTVPVTSIDWGIVSPGETKSVTIYVFNDGNIPLNMSYTVDNWVPTNATVFLSCTVSMPAVIQARSHSQLTITLNVSADIVDIVEFQYQITIIGSE
jgi:hypothetical protein